MLGNSPAMTQTIELLTKLIAFNTINANSNLQMIAYLREYLETRGFTVHQIDDPIEKKAGLFATIGPTDSAGVLLSGHTDVVPTDGQEWTKDPFSLTKDGERLYGRGTTDMKGFVASMLTAADLASKSTLTRPLKLSFSYDEEIGCVGIKHMIDHLANTIGLPEFAIVGEPTSMKIAIGHKGKAAIRAICKGQDGHSALAPKFVNALHIATDFVTALRHLQNEIAECGARDDAYSVPFSTIHVGKLNAGTALNMVPAIATVDFEYRHLATDKGSEIMQLITQAAQQVEAEYKPHFPAAAIELKQLNSYPGLETATNHRVIEQVAKLSQSGDTTKVGFGTEAGYFNNLEVPTVVCGPGSMQGQGHQPDEFIEIRELAKCDDMMKRLVHSLAN